MMNKCDGKCMCDIDFSEDNGYGYILEELKATRAHIDEIIKIVELRMKKDKIIDEVLDTEYSDDEDVLDGLREAVEENQEPKKEARKTNPIDIDTLIKVASINNILNAPMRPTYPWTTFFKI